jgi:hypothetical protein
VALVLVAGIAEGVFFTVIDPQELYLFGEPVHFSKLATYSIGFFGFWAVCAASSLMTWFLQLGRRPVGTRPRRPPGIGVSDSIGSAFPVSPCLRRPHQSVGDARD